MSAGEAWADADPTLCPTCNRDSCEDHLPGVTDRLTEAGAAERFARLHGDGVRFDHRRQRWLMWQGHRWQPDADAAVPRLALTFARVWQRDALDLPDRTHREEAIKFAF